MPAVHVLSWVLAWLECESVEILLARPCAASCPLIPTPVLCLPGTPVGGTPAGAQQLECGRTLVCFDTNILMGHRAEAQKAWAAIEAGGGRRVQALVPRVSALLALLWPVLCAGLLYMAARAAGLQLC